MRVLDCKRDCYFRKTRWGRGSISRSYQFCKSANKKVTEVKKSECIKND